MGFLVVLNYLYVCVRGVMNVVFFCLYCGAVGARVWEVMSADAIPLILTFNTPKIPESLKLCYLNIPVTQYVPNPIRCYKCQRSEPCHWQM